MSELRVGALLGFARECKCSAGSAAGSSAGGTSKGQRGHKCSVDCELRATPKCKSICNDFNAALILPGDIDVEVTFLELPLHAEPCAGPGLERAPRRRPLDQRPSAEPHRGPPVVVE